MAKGELFLPSKALGAIVGHEPLSREEVVRNLWHYIKDRGLQDGRTVNADDKLMVLFGGEEYMDMIDVVQIVHHHLDGVFEMDTLKDFRRVVLLRLTRIEKAIHNHIGTEPDDGGEGF